MVTVIRLDMIAAASLSLLIVACSSVGGADVPDVQDPVATVIEGTATAQSGADVPDVQDPAATVIEGTATAHPGSDSPDAQEPAATVVEGTATAHPGSDLPDVQKPAFPPEQPGGPRDESVPDGLALPFDAGNLPGDRDFMSPFGVYRKSADRPEFGHSGIDIPMANGNPIYAVADGRVVKIEPTVDRRPGSVVQILLGEDDDSELGWTFIYEHIDLEPGIVLGTKVARGQQIGSNAMPTGENNNHLQLSFVFNDQGFTRDHTCWADHLAPDENAELDLWFDALKGSNTLSSGWRNATDEGYYPLRGLLDETAYPDGPQLCYDQGTDVRVVY